MAYLPLLPVSPHISPGFSWSSVFLYISCLLLPRLTSNGKASTSYSPTTLHHHPPSTRLHHTATICSRPCHHRHRPRRTTTILRVHPQILMCPWTASGKACGKRRNDRWRPSHPRSSPLSDTVGRPHHHRSQLGRPSLTRRTSSQRNYKKENPRKSALPVSPFLSLSHPTPRFPPRVSHISRNHYPRIFGP